MYGLKFLDDTWAGLEQDRPLVKENARQVILSLAEMAGGVGI